MRQCGLGEAVRLPLLRYVHSIYCLVLRVLFRIIVWLVQAVTELTHLLRRLHCHVLSTECCPKVQYTCLRAVR